MPTTPFGKQVRKFRIDADRTLSDMADKLDVSAAYLSSVETGRKPLNEQLVKRCVDYFRKLGIEAAGLLELADRCRKEMSVAHLDERERAAISAFARKLPQMSREKRKEMIKILEEE